VKPSTRNYFDFPATQPTFPILKIDSSVLFVFDTQISIPFFAEAQNAEISPFSEFRASFRKMLKKTHEKLRDILLHLLIKYTVNIHVSSSITRELFPN
jgi:hypothetical protein